MARMITEQLNIRQPLRRISEEIACRISPETARRIDKHEKIVKRACELAESMAQEHAVKLRSITVGPTWSHEYDERSGVTVHVDIAATNDARFSYWEALNKALEDLAQSLPTAGRNWLENEVSITVMRS